MNQLTIILLHTSPKFDAHFSLFIPQQTAMLDCESWFSILVAALQSRVEAEIKHCGMNSIVLFTNNMHNNLSMIRLCITSSLFVYIQARDWNP